MNQLTFTTSLFINLAVVIGLKLENVTIPAYGVKDGMVTLHCHFNMEEDTLLVLKWYKDSHEFYRFSPQVIPPILDFPVQGVHVDVAQSSLNQVTLRNISLKSSGNYKCEVSADRPSFRTLSQQREMMVVAPPPKDPEISGVGPAVSVGDTLTANCSSYHSQPAASLMFYINHEKAESSEIREYLPVPEPEGLETSILGLKFVVEPRHFKGGGLELKCTATIGNTYRVKRISVAEANINAQPSIPNNRALLSGASYFSYNLKTGLSLTNLYHPFAFELFIISFYAKLVYGILRH